VPAQGRFVKPICRISLHTVPTLKSHGIKAGPIIHLKTRYPCTRTSWARHSVCMDTGTRSRSPTWQAIPFPAIPAPLINGRDGNAYFDGAGANKVQRQISKQQVRIKDIGFQGREVSVRRAKGGKDCSRRCYFR